MGPWAVVTSPVSTTIVSCSPSCRSHGQTAAVYSHMKELITELKAKGKVMSLGLYPEVASQLYLEGNGGKPVYLHLPCDQTMGLHTLKDGCWDLVKVHWTQQALEGVSGEVAIIDVGANFGLTTRQLLADNDNIKLAFCYEPHPHHYGLMKCNIGGVRDVRLIPHGLAPQAGSVTMYREDSNFGNCSSNRSVASGDGDTVEVQLLSADSERAKWETWFPSGHFIYKSDTQGSDMSIATSIGPSFWARVKCAFFEVWSGGVDSFDEDALIRILDHFPSKLFDSNHDKNLTSEEVLEWIKAPGKPKEADLLCKK